jgi:transcriptional regulator with XRE-family HTH domain
MASREITHGSVATYVRRNVAELRVQRRMTLAQLSEAMGQLGRPILPSGLGKIEKGDRRVDVDDLVALAMALNVTPTRLLLPGGADPDSSSVELTGSRAVPWARAWAWATGREALPSPDRPVDAETTLDEEYEFTEASRPFDPPPDLLMSEIEAKEANLGPLIQEWIAAIKRGESAEELVLFLRAESLLNRLDPGGEIRITHDTRRSRG